jgi:squalene synthase HpnC
MAASAQAQIETPSGKGAGNENFPVGSILLPRHLRPHVARFYAFARAIDDIADNPALAPEDKVARLALMAEAIEGRHADDTRLAVAHRCRESLLETKVPTRHCLDLVDAFVQDATKLRYRDWDDLMGYCIRSAAPVGRYLLDLHGEDRTAWPASDALCNALQVLNHLQDCKDDKQALDRVYLPEPWLNAANATVDDLLAKRASAGVRRVIDDLLDRTDVLIAEARRLPGQLRSKRLAMESAVIVCIAAKLSRELRRRDPVAERVELSKMQFLWCCAAGAASVWP